METKEIYQQLILEHNRAPKNYRKMDSPTHVSEGYNPLCGDHFHIYLHIKEGMLVDMSFEGSGCAISKASASLMTQALKGKPLDEIKILESTFRKLLAGPLTEAEMTLLGKLKIFSNIWQFPARVKCAGLAWRAASGALENTKTVSTE